MRKNEGLIIIPAYNEAANIAAVIQSIRHCNYALDMIVINDGSQDGTGQIVRNMGEKVIDHFFNIGYGGALQTGYKYAAAQDYKFVIQFDADGQHDPDDIAAIRQLLCYGDCDIVIGSRFTVSVKSAGFLKGVMIRFFRFLIRYFTGTTITDPTSGLQGLKRDVFVYYAKIGNFPEDYPDSDTLIAVLKKGFKIAEIPIQSLERLSGKSMHHGFRSVYYVVKMMVSIFVVLLRCRFRKKVVQHV